MNENLIEAKSKFDTIGYCTFSLKDFDLEFYEFIKDYVYCNSNDNFKEFFKTFRFDSTELETIIRDVESFEIADSKKEELLSKYGNHTISQCWYYDFKFDDFEKLLAKKRNSKKKNIREYFENKITDICEYFYQNSSLKENLLLDELQLSLYNKGCRFGQHLDSIGSNYCSIIIYLNEDYKDEYGGLLLLNDEKIVPEIGKVAIMDLEKHQVRHGVSEVISGPGRFAILCFPKKRKID